MTKVKPFRGVLYNSEKFADLSALVCPPYDVISPKEQENYHNRNLHNFIHILLGQDIPGEDKYKRSANHFKEWLKDRSLIQDNKPAVYFYEQDYKIRGEKRTRIGFIALLGLPEKTSTTFAHEHTRLEPKEDRFKLIKSVKANLSPIFLVFADKKRIIQRISAKYLSKEKPFIDIIDDREVRHKLWRITDAEVLADLENKMADESIFIADGHHRYEVACAYRDLMKQNNPDTSGQEPFNYVMGYFTNTDPRGLTIQPIHRLLKLKDEKQFVKIFDLAQEYFDLEQIKDKTKFFFLLEKAGKTEHVIGLYKDKKYWFLRLKNIKILDKMMPDKPKEYRLLDVSILNSIIFGKILNLSAAEKDSIIFSHDAQEVLDEVDKHSDYVGFILNPVTMQQIMDVALTGNKMPPKSTFFYPKVWSGLVINKLD